ncbi:carbohydrate ABC transporter permease [Microvirga brassicacearum]|uniref:Sugar ABC transporter permease n=1 Tax=Microvirga brassicacearum TaxID=2580413 RepID=A0A5N3P5E0_9HYPH|nr:sugar ABC transporter permease [Microvirga brassicacearum]KAB0264913.1 sugar ABC transporter permease [Microvirga brassicacearum]
MDARTEAPLRLKRTWSSVFETGFGARIYPYFLVFPAVVIVLGVVVYPVISGILWSFYDVTLRKLVSGDVAFVGLRNFQRVFEDPAFLQASYNTLIWVVLNVIAQLGLGLALALLLHRAIPGIGFFRSGILVPWVVPSVVAVLTWRWMYDPSVGIVNELLVRLGVIDAYHPWLGDTATSLYAVTVESIWKGTPFVMLLLLAALQLVPRSILEAASMDGAPGWRKLWYVILPQIRVSFAIAAVLTFILTVNNFNAIWLMTEGGPLNSSEILFTLAYKYGFQRFDLGMASAVATMLFIGLVIATTLYLKLMQAREGD